MTGTQIDRLMSRQECADLIVRTARAIDRCDETLLRAQFHDEAQDDHGSFKGSIDEFVKWVMPVLHTMERTQHILGQMLIEMDGDGAVSETYFEAHHELMIDGAMQHMIAAGRYLDTFERRGGIWKISKRHAVYDWQSVQPSTDSADRSSPGDIAYGQRGDSDASYAHFSGIRS